MAASTASRYRGGTARWRRTCRRARPRRRRRPRRRAPTARERRAARRRRATRRTPTGAGRRAGAASEGRATPWSSHGTRPAGIIRRVPNRRPRLALVGAPAPPAEAAAPRRGGRAPGRGGAAAVVAAGERFRRDTAPPPAPAPEPPSGWVRAARLEAVERF